jgi:hypothetical protein
LSLTMAFSSLRPLNDHTEKANCPMSKRIDPSSPGNVA